jgi:hypothetical protein
MANQLKTQLQKLHTISTKSFIGNPNSLYIRDASSTCRIGNQSGPSKYQSIASGMVSHKGPVLAHHDYNRSLSPVVHEKISTIEDIT